MCASIPVCDRATFCDWMQDAGPRPKDHRRRTKDEALTVETPQLTISITAPAGTQPTAEDEALWYKDAVIYEAHVKSFFDSNNDGIGDYQGLTQKLDYLQGLGVTCIWLLPFFPSP